MGELISVIIPAYNVGGYIGKCLQSVISQTYCKLEIIIINDGSTDITTDIIKSFLPDPRIKYIDQKNSGVTAARNKGIEASTGDFIAFVDSDDYLELDMYEKLLSALIKYNADFAVCDYNLIYDDHVDEKYSNINDEIVDIKMPGYFYKYCCCPKPNNYIWTRLYKADIIKKVGVCFENFKLGDDTLFNFKLLPHMKRAAHISPGMYNYYQRSNSNVYTVATKSNLATVYADTFESLINSYKENGFQSFLTAMPIHAYTRLRSVIFYSRLASLDEQSIADNIKDGFKKRIIIEYLRDTSGVEEYVKTNDLPIEMTMQIETIMQAAADDPEKLIGVELP